MRIRSHRRQENENADGYHNLITMDRVVSRQPMERAGKKKKKVEAQRRSRQREFNGGVAAIMGSRVSSWASREEGRQEERGRKDMVRWQSGRGNKGVIHQGARAAKAARRGFGKIVGGERSGKKKKRKSLPPPLFGERSKKVADGSGKGNAEWEERKFVQERSHHQAGEKGILAFERGVPGIFRPSNKPPWRKSQSSEEKSENS